MAMVRFGGKPKTHTYEEFKAEVERLAKEKTLQKKNPVKTVRA